MTIQTDEVTRQVRSAFSDQQGEFRPYAIFDEALDCIRVITRDCSATEVRINNLITILEDNYPQAGLDLCVGFTIKGAKHFCSKNGVPFEKAVRLTDLLDAIVRVSPDALVRLVVSNIVRPLAKGNDVEVVDLEAA